MRSFPRGSRFSVLGSIFLCALSFSSAAAADPPSRVARLAQLNGAVSFSPAGEEEWVLATPNRPLITGDRVWVDAGARAELQLGAIAVRLGSGTSVTILNLDDRVAQFQLSQGTVSIRVRRMGADEFVEVDTPQLAFIQRRAGNFRLDVDPEGRSTAVAVRTGEGEAWGEGASFLIGAGRWYRFFDTGLRDYESDAMPPQDAFDRWAFDRDRREDTAVAARYVAPEVIGYSDLDEYGEWSKVETYGNVWIPRSVPSGWAPYRYGHWAWIEPWGWTWVDDAPWGFAPFHYGRWAYARNRWCWVPGPVRARPVYAPALVAFVGGGNFRLSVSSGGSSPGIAWFPLGPGEVFRPSYRVSRGYFTNVNVSNTQINNTYVTNIYNNGNAGNVVYQNQRRPSAVTAVPANAFVQSRPVAQAAVPVSSDTVARVPSTPFAALAPTRASVAGAGTAAGAHPPAASQQRPVVARNSPPPAATPFAQRLPALSKDPGKPLDVVTSAPAPATKGPSTPIRLVTPAQGGAPVPIPQAPTRSGGSPPGSPQAAPRTATPPSTTGQAPAAPVPQPPGMRPSTPLGTTTPPPSAPTSARPPATGASSTVSAPPAPSSAQRAPVPPPQPSGVAPSAPPGETRRVTTPPPATSGAPPAAEVRRGPPSSVVAPPAPPAATPPAETRRAPAPPAPSTAAPPAAEVRRGPAPPPAAPAATPAEEVRRPPTPPGGAQAPAPVPKPPEVRPPPPATVARPPGAPPPVPEARREAPPPQAPSSAPATMARPPVAPPAPVPEVRREPPRPQAAPPAPTVSAPAAQTEAPKGGPRREGRPKEEEKKPEGQ